MRKSIGQLVRNPILAFTSLAYLAVDNGASSLYLYLSGSTEEHVVNTLLGMIVTMLVSAFFMAGNGNMLKRIITQGTCHFGDFLHGVREFFLKIFEVNLLILLVVLFAGPIPLQFFEPLLVMGGYPQSFFLSVLSIILSPFLMLWYPGIINKLEIWDSFGVGFDKAKNLYMKLMLCLLLGVLPFGIYKEYAASVGHESQVAYYASSGVALLLSLIALIAIFNAYFSEDSSSGSDS